MTSTVAGARGSLRFLRYAALPVFLLSAGGSLTQGQPGPTNESVAVVLTPENKAEVLKAGANDWVLAQTNQVLQAKELLRTGLRSRATLRLANQSVLRANQLTTPE